MVSLPKVFSTLRRMHLIKRITGLVLEGKSKKALVLIEKDAGLKREFYAKPALLRERMLKHLTRTEPNIAALYSRSLALTLFKVDRTQDAVAVLEADFNLDSRDYRDFGCLAERLRAKLSPLAPESAMAHLQSLSQNLGFVDRHADALALWLVDLGLERNVKKDVIFEAAQGRFAGAEFPEFRVFYMMGIWSALSASGRMADALAVVCAFVGVEDIEGSLDSPESIEKVRSLLAPLDANMKASIIMVLVLTLLSQDRSILNLLGELLGLKTERYDDPDHISEALETWRSSLLSGGFWNLVSLLVMALIIEDESEAALKVCRTAAGAAHESADGFFELGSALRGQRDALCEERLVFFVAVVSGALIAAGEPKPAVTVLEGFTGLRPGDYRSIQSLASQLSVPLEAWKIALASGFLSALLRALRVAGETERAAMLVEVYLDRFDPVQGLDGLDFIPGLIEFYSVWLEYFGQVASKQPLGKCQDFVNFIRLKMISHGVDLKDRIDFIAVTKNLRANIIEVGLFWAQRDSDQGAARPGSVDVQLWDAELTQRLLVERFILEPILSVQRGARPTLEWPWNDETERPNRDVYLPDEALVQTASGSLDESVDAARPSEHVLESCARLQEMHPRLFQRAREIVMRGVDEAQMAEIIGPTGLLLRATFGSKGRLLWFALRRDGLHVDVAAQEIGVAGDLDRLRWAGARHDFRLALARFRKKFAGRLPAKLVAINTEAGQYLESLLQHLGSSGTADRWSRQLDEIAQFMSTRPDREILNKLLLPILALLRVVPSEESFSEWAGSAADQLQAFQELLSTRSRQPLQAELNQITADYIEEVGQLWRLERLSSMLSPETDLVVQLDDALHAVPVAHLSVGGEPLFRQVRSIRSSLSLLMTSMQSETDQELRRGGDDTGLLLNVSYLKQHDKAREGAVWLQYGLSILARRYGCKVYGAADEPVGSAGLLRTALEDLRSFRVLTICGHGDFFRSGIELAGSEGTASTLWEGGGCDLSGVDWLWMVSCSIGRLGENGDRDIEGFCVRLALHRARSVAAFRWPVHSLEAAAFVNESVRQYLEAREPKDVDDAGHLRARALNDARKSFFGDGIHPPLYSQVGLNTAAACELFGLG